MGRLRPWHNLPPVLQCNKYRRLSENTQQIDSISDTSDEADNIVGLGGGVSDTREKKCKRKTANGGGKRNRKKDCTRQLIQESFQELMSYSCGQCGHVQTLQAEELKSILGHAFRLAYAAHLQKAAGLHDFPAASPPPPPPAATRHSNQRHLVAQSLHSLQSSTQHNILQSSSPSSLKNIHGYSSSNSSSSSCSSSNNNNNNSSDKAGRLHPHTDAHTHTHTDQRPCDQTCLTSTEATSNGGSSSSSSSGVSSILGNRQAGSSRQPNRKMRTPASLPGLQADQRHHSSRVSPDSDTSNSPTDHNTSHRLLDKPPLLKQFSVPPLEEAPAPPTTAPHSPTHHLVDPCNNNNTVNNLNGGVIGYSNDGSKNKINSTGDSCSGSVLAHNITDTDSNILLHNQHSNTVHLEHSPTHFPLHAILSSHSTHSQSPIHSTHSHSESPLHSTHSSQSPLHSSSHCPTPPPLPERTDSLTAPDEPHLRAAAWFQAGIPREIALEVLGREPQGAFLVRESSSKPGCYALSLRVPTDFAAAGIAHYLIVRTNRGYRIKGFTKEFPTLRTLITHHSVMPELLPVPLLLTRHNPAYSDHNDGKDPGEEDPDYNTLSDFRKMMSDLNV